LQCNTEKQETEHVDEPGFRAFLAKRNLADFVEAHISTVREFEEYLKKKDGDKNLDKTQPNDFDDFVRILISKERGTYNEVKALARYFLFSNNKKLTIHILERIDGIDVMENLSRHLKEEFGEANWVEVFGDLKLPNISTNSIDKAEFTQKIMERLESKLDTEEYRQVLSSNLHFVPDDEFYSDRETFEKSNDIESFLKNRHAEYAHELEEYAKQKTLYYTQEVDDEVVEYVRKTQTCQVGVKEGNVIYVTKIPYMTKKFLHETDQRMKRYYACHCPWVREAIKQDIKISSEFCNCSAGFEKRLWDVIFGRPVKADVLQTVLKGDSVCQFAIHIPRQHVESKKRKSKKKMGAAKNAL
jgi:hypothetical protein